jgi:hypothetical protein
MVRSTMINEIHAGLRAAGIGSSAAPSTPRLIRPNP